MKIFVGNLSLAATEEDLLRAFEQHGKVSEVSVVKDRETGKPRGFAFVEMPNANEAATAIKRLNLVEINGRSITVNEARPQPDRRRGGGSRRRR